VGKEVQEADGAEESEEEREAAFQGHVTRVLSALRHAVQLRCCCIEQHVAPGKSPQPNPSPTSPVLILFSGGVDSTLLAALTHEVLPPHVPIELCNVCFAGGSSPDRVAARDALEELAAVAPSRDWRLIEVDSNLEEVDAHSARILTLLHPAGTIMDLNIGAALWLAVGARGKLRRPVSWCMPKQPSGGASDAAASAAPEAAASAVSTITTASAASAASGGGFAKAEEAIGSSSMKSSPCCQGGGADPGTAAGKESLEGWQLGNPGGIAGDDEGGDVAAGARYRSSARVVLLGHGADEQCAGYGRHRTRFRNGGMAGLAEELTLDMQRMWLRNLGRDDRLVADWGKEARHPFLDEGFMAALLDTPLHAIADLRAPPGTGDKRILRAALAQMGLPKAAKRVKRAIQFGTRIGKLSNIREFGSNRAANTRNAGTVELHTLWQH